MARSGGSRRRSNRNSRHRKRSSAIGGTASRVLAHAVPSSYNARPVQVRKIRYVASSGGLCSVFRNCVLSLFFADSSVSATTQCTFPISSARISMIQIWQGTSAGTGFQGTSLCWAGGQYAKDKEVQKIGSNTYPGYIRASPPKDSAADFWSVAGKNESELLFSIHASDSSCVVDIELQYTLADGLCSYGAMSSTQAAANFFTAALDCFNTAGTGTGTNKLIPEGTSYAQLASRTPVGPQQAESVRPSHFVKQNLQAVPKMVLHDDSDDDDDLDVGISSLTPDELDLLTRLVKKTANKK